MADKRQDHRNALGYVSFFDSQVFKECDSVLGQTAGQLAGQQTEFMW